MADDKDVVFIGSSLSDVREIPIHAEGAYRVIYVAKFEDAVYVLHAF
jgi:phage-related protein